KGGLLEHRSALVYWSSKSSSAYSTYGVPAIHNECVAAGFASHMQRDRGKRGGTLRIEELAKNRGNGVSTLHHHFRALTAMSPLQYQKQLHLHAARERMLMDGVDAASAAFEVGYESASQFNREYSRFFGQPPMRDIRTLRSPTALPMEFGNRQSAI